MGEEKQERKISREHLELTYEILFKRITDIMKHADIHADPFGEMINRLTVLSGIFSFRAMISIIPELVAFTIRYGMEIEKAYEEDQFNIEEDIQGFDEEGQEKRISKIQQDIDKLSMYL